MREATANGLGTFVLVTVGILVAGVVLGQADTAVVLAPMMGVTFGVATYLMVRGT